MTPYDAAMLGVVVAGMVWGAWRGITWQVASIASLVLGYLFAHPLSAQLAPHFPGEPVVARALAMLAVYALVSGGVFLVAWAIRATLRQMKFEAYDRHLGMVLGGLEGGLLGLIGTLFVTSLAPQTRGPIFSSPSGKVVARVMDTVGPVLPTEVRTAVEPFWTHREMLAKSEDRAAEEKPVETGSTSKEDRRWDGTRRVSEQGDQDGNLKRTGLGRAAGEAIEKSLEQGDAAPVRDLIKEGRSRLGRAAGQALEKQINQLGDSDGRDPQRR